MKILENFEFDYCSIRQAVYAGNLHMPPHNDDESKISIILDGTLVEKTPDRFIEAKRNSVVVKPSSAVHENVFGLRGVRILSINFTEAFSIPAEISNWDWFEDPRISFHAYKLYFSIKSVKTDKQLLVYLNDFIQSINILRKTRQTNAPEWLGGLLDLLKKTAADKETINNIAEKLKLSRVHISRTVQKFHSVSPVKYRHYSRLSDLLYCLTCTDKSLAEISYECGFTDQSQMSRIVLKETGLTPNSLRMLLRQA